MKEKILLSHGSGGRQMHDLIGNLLLKKLNNPILAELSDSAYISYKERLAFSTDSFVMSPIRIDGADIGKLAVCGTVNDLLMQGAIPQYLSLAFIIEEGLDYKTLSMIVSSISAAANDAKVKIVTGDFKVVEKGSCDKMFINTSGIGRIIVPYKFSLKNISVGDRVIVSGTIARHGLAVLSKRKDLDLGFKIKSDCASLRYLLAPILKIKGIKFMRDPTRGGLATTLNEIAERAGVGIFIQEKNIPLGKKVKAACEILGIDPLYVANEGVAVLVVAKEKSSRILRLLRGHPLGVNAREIGFIVKKHKKQVVLQTAIGTERIVDMLSGDALPRIC